MTNRPAGLLVSQDAVDKGLGIENGQIVGPLAQPDQLDGHAQLPLDRYDNAALGRAVQLGQDMPVTPMAWAKTLAWIIPFCPVVASRTSRTSSTGRFFSITRRILPN